MVKAIVLHRSNVVDSWSCILENAHGNAIHIYRNTAAAILAARLPDVYLERVLVRPKHWSKQEEREYLLVTNQSFTEYPIYIGSHDYYIGSHDYGNNLAIYWYLVVSSDLFVALSSGTLHLFQEQELRAYVTVIHRCLRHAVSELLLSFGQDASFLEPKSMGFLGVT